jgi:hypothetical protein
MAGPGRNTKLTPETQKVICDSIAAGIDRKHSALRAGTSARTVRMWLQNARRPRAKAEYVAFAAAMKKAEADAVARNVALIQKAAQDGTWTAAAWWLERRHPDLYGSDRKRVRELERLLADIIRGGGGAGKPTPKGKK